MTADTAPARPLKQEQEPASETVTEVAPNILRLQLPIDMPGLGHVNTYVLADDRGVALMDPGLPGDDSWRALVGRLASIDLRPSDVHTVFVTHGHPDHFGLAPRLARSRDDLEILTHEAFGAGWRSGDEDDDLILNDVDLDDIVPNAYEGVTPWGVEWDHPRRSLAFQLERPRPTRYIRDGEPVRLAGREMFTVHSPGHTLDHVCLHDPEAGVLFSGDHVLPTITPHISGLGSGRDPLDLFDAALERVGGMSGIEVVLPAHGHPFTDLHGRAEAIREHHRERLLRLRAVSQDLGPASVEELSHHLFRQAHWGRMAESETFAHLEHLRLAGLAQRDGEGSAMRYTLAAP